MRFRVDHQHHPSDRAREASVRAMPEHLLRTELDKISNSPGFAKSERLTRFLRFVVEETLSGRGSQLKESLVGVAVFNREPTYDTRIDGVVRTEAIKLRSRLKTYYETDGRQDEVRIDLPKGTYVPVFTRFEQAWKPWFGRNGLLWFPSVLAIMGLGGYWTVHRSRAASIPPNRGPATIAVLPFVNLSSDRENEYLSDGLTEELIGSLARLPGMRVAARTSAFRFKGKASDVQAIGRELKAGLLLEGGVRKEGGTLRVSARLIQVADGYLVWSETYQRDVKDVFAIQEEISAAVAGALRRQAAHPAANQSGHPRARNMEVYSLYLKGRYFSRSLRPVDLLRGSRYYQQAIDRDPEFADAYAGLARTCMREYLRTVFAPGDICPRAKAVAERALALDSSLAEAHVALAEIRAFYEHDWAAGWREFQEAFRLDPESPDVHHSYALYLMFQGRFEESLAAMKRYLELDGADPNVDLELGHCYFRGRRWNETIEATTRAAQTDPNLPVTRTLLGISYSMKGKFDEAVQETREGVRLADTMGDLPGSIMTLGYAYAASGQKDRALEQLNRLKNLRKERYVSPFYLAAIYAGLHEKERALNALEQNFREGGIHAAMIGVEPYFDSLRSESRFHALLRKAGVPHLIPKEYAER